MSLIVTRQIMATQSWLQPEDTQLLPCVFGENGLFTTVPWITTINFVHFCAFPGMSPWFLLGSLTLSVFSESSESSLKYTSTQSRKYVVQNTAAVVFPSLSLKPFNSLLVSDWCWKLSRHLHWASTMQTIAYFFPWEVTTNSEAIDVYKEINLFHLICIPLQPATMNVIYHHVAQLSQATCSRLFINKFGHFAIQIPSYSDS